MRSRVALALVAVLATAVPLLLPVAGTSSAATGSAPSAATPDAVIGTRVLGTTRGDRKIRAYHLGEEGEPKVVLISTMHGNEAATRFILRSLVEGKPVHGIDLWVVPVYNPDGLAARTRKNARGVDLNRNYPFRWVDLDGNYESGRRPASERETRAMMAFLKDVQPRWLLSFHQPLRGVDTDTKRPKFARRVARTLDLPRKTLDCGGVCHGTMTSWYNHKFDGTALTVEYGAHPTRKMMRVLAPRRVLKVFGAWRGTPQAEPAPAQS